MRGPFFHTIVGIENAKRIKRIRQENKSPTETMQVEFPAALSPDLLPDYPGYRKSEVNWENDNGRETEKTQINDNKIPFIGLLLDYPGCRKGEVNWESNCKGTEKAQINISVTKSDY